jgi:hypothetical protein
MAVFHVQVGVALRRPPRTDEYRRVAVEADSWWEAQLVAAQIAACTSVMPVSTELIEMRL